MADVAPMVDEYRQLSGKSTTPLRHDIVCVHTMVGTLEGSISWSARSGGSYWHFGLGGGGRLVQCQDLRYRSAANLEGNPYCIPIETADMEKAYFQPWGGSDVPAWTDAQIDKLVELIAWLCKRYSIPAVLVPDTKPGRRGLAYHRQGIDPWRVPGGDSWSSATGKVCPGDRRIHQFTSVVIPRVQAALGEGDDMPLSDDDLKKIASVVWAYQVDESTGTARSTLRDARTISRRHEIAAAGRADLWLVKGDGAGQPWWYVTDLVTKRKITGFDQANRAVDDFGVRAEPKVDGNWQPLVLPQVFIDQIPEAAVEDVPAPPS